MARKRTLNAETGLRVRTVAPPNVYIYLIYDKEIDHVFYLQYLFEGHRIRGAFWNRKTPVVYSGLFSFLEVCFRQLFVFDDTAKPKLAR
jgi:hypothetical protein